ncbi:unnamed protein product [Gordionus sp. m RMFG-2023]
MHFINGLEIDYDFPHLDPIKIGFNDEKTLLCCITLRSIHIYFSDPFVELVNFYLDKDSLRLYGHFKSFLWQKGSKHIITLSNHGYILFFSVQANYENIQNFFALKSRSDNAIRHGFIMSNLPQISLFSLPNFTFIDQQITSLNDYFDQIIVATIDGYLQFYEWPSFNSSSVTVSFKFNINELIHNREKSKTDLYVIDIDHSWIMLGFAIVLSDGRSGYIPHSQDRFSTEDIKWYFAQNIKNAVSCCLNPRLMLIAFGTKSQAIHLFTYESLDADKNSIGSHALKPFKSFDYSITDILYHNMAAFEYIEDRQFKSPKQSTQYQFSTDLKLTFTEDGLVLFVQHANNYIKAFSVFGYYLFGIPNMTDEGTDSTGFLSSNPSLICHTLGLQDYSLWVLMSSPFPSNTKNFSDSFDNALKTPKNTAEIITPRAKSVIKNRKHVIVLQSESCLYIGSPLFYNVNKFKERIFKVKDKIYNGVNECHGEYFSNIRDLVQIQVPISYLNHNKPIKMTAIDKSGQGIAIAGKNGFLHYNTLTRKWKMFGNESQERQFSIYGGLVWWKEFIFLACLNTETKNYELRAYPQSTKLDNANLAAKYEIPSAPNPLSIYHMDVYNDFVGAAFSNCTIAMYYIEPNDDINSSKSQQPHIKTLSLININVIDISAISPHPFCILSFALTFFSIDSVLSKTKPHNKRISEIPKPNSNMVNAENINKQTILPPNIIMNVCGDLICLQRHKKRSASFSLTSGDIVPTSTRKLDKKHSLKGSDNQQSSILSLAFVNPDKDNTQTVINENPYDYSVSLIANGVEIFWVHDLKEGKSSPGSVNDHDFLNSNNCDLKTKDHDKDKMNVQPYLLDTIWLFRGSDGLKVWLPLSHPSGYSIPKCDLFSKRVMLSFPTTIYPLVIHMSSALIEGINQSCTKERVLDYLYQPKINDEKRLLNDHMIFNDKYSVHRYWQHVLPDILKDLIEKNLSLQALDVAHCYSARSPYHSSNNSEVLNEFALSNALETLLHRVLECDPSKPPLFNKFQEFGGTDYRHSRDVKHPKKSTNQDNATNSPPFITSQKHVEKNISTIKQQDNYKRLSTGNLNLNNVSSLSPRPSDPEPLLPRVLAFLREFPFDNYVPVLVRCARKSEIALWPKLFSVDDTANEDYNFNETNNDHGKTDSNTDYIKGGSNDLYDNRPAKLFKECVKRGDLETATSLLIILQNLESFSKSFRDAEILLLSTLDKERWDLAKEIARYLNSIMKDTENDQSTKSAPTEETILSKEDIKSNYPLFIDNLLSDKCPYCNSKDAEEKFKFTTSIDKTTEYPYRINDILDKYAVNLIIDGELKRMATFAANMNFPLVPFLSLQRFKACAIKNYINAFKKLHAIFDWPYGHYVNIKYNLKNNGPPRTKSWDLSPRTSQITSPTNSYEPRSDIEKTRIIKNNFRPSEIDKITLTPNSFMPSTPDVNLAKLMEPIDIQGPDSRKSQINIDILSPAGDSPKYNQADTISMTDTINYSQQYTMERPSTLNLITVANPNQKDCESNIKNGIKNKVNDSLADCSKQELQLRYLLKIFMESGCLDWALLICLILGDVNSTSHTLNVWLKKIHDQHVNIIQVKCPNQDFLNEIIHGLHELMKWAENECPYYEYLICQMLNPLLEFDDKVKNSGYSSNKKSSNDQLFLDINSKILIKNESNHMNIDDKNFVKIVTTNNNSQNSCLIN